jgi:hypothetical protein
MKVQVNLSPEEENKIVKAWLYEILRICKDDINSNVPMYSYDMPTNKKMLKKDIKAIKRILEWT